MFKTSSSEKTSVFLVAGVGMAAVSLQGSPCYAAREFVMDSRTIIKGKLPI